MEGESRWYVASRPRSIRCKCAFSTPLSLSWLWEGRAPSGRSPESLSHHPHHLTGLLYLVWEHSCPCVCMARFSTRQICVQVASRRALTQSLYLRLQPPHLPGTPVPLPTCPPSCICYYMTYPYFHNVPPIFSPPAPRVHSPQGRGFWSAFFTRHPRCQEQSPASRGPGNACWLSGCRRGCESRAVLSLLPTKEPPYVRQHFVFSAGLESSYFQ